MYLAGLYAEIFPRGGGGEFGVRTKEGGRGGGSLCGVLHPTLAGGARMTQRGENSPPCPP